MYLIVYLLHIEVSTTIYKGSETMTLKTQIFLFGKNPENYKNSKIIKTQKTEKSLKNRKQINKWNYKKKIPGSFQKTGKKKLEKRHIWQSSRRNISTFANLSIITTLILVTNIKDFFTAKYGWHFFVNVYLLWINDHYVIT